MPTIEQMMHADAEPTITHKASRMYEHPVYRVLRGVNTQTGKLTRRGMELRDPTGDYEIDLENAEITMSVITSDQFVFAGVPTYTPSNVTTTRTFDANNTSVAELADVLGTLLADLGLD